MNREFMAENITPFFNRKEENDRIFDYDENLYNDPFCQEMFDQTLKNSTFKKYSILLKKLENERYDENY